MLKKADRTGNSRTGSGEEFFEIVHEILVKERRYGVREIAAQLGMSYPTFYARLSGRASFSPDEVKHLLQIVSDVRLVDWIVANSKFIAVARPDTDVRSSPKRDGTRFCLSNLVSR